MLVSIEMSWSDYTSGPNRELDRFNAVVALRMPGSVHLLGIIVIAYKTGTLPLNKVTIH